MAITFTIPGAAGAALQLDSAGLWREIGGAAFTWQCVRAGLGSRFRVTADEASARIIRREAVDRLAMQGGEGFDDPKSWAPALRRAIASIDAALLEATK